MSRHRRGRITVQHQPTGAERAMMRGMGVVHAVMGFVFVVVSLTTIIPHAGLFGLPFLVGGGFFCINGIRIAVSKNDVAHRVGYDVETDIQQQTIVGLLEEPEQAPRVSDPSSPSVPTELNAKARLEQLQNLKTAGLISEKEYQEKRREIIDRL